MPIESQSPPEKPNRRKRRPKLAPYVPPVRRRGLGKVIGALVATLVVVGLLLAHVWGRYRVLTLGYEISELSQQREALLEENRSLRIELRMMTRPDRLEPLANKQLGLVQPKPEQLLYVDKSTLPLPQLIGGKSDSEAP